MTYYCKHNICPMETNIPQATDTVLVTRDLHFQQIADLCHVPMEEIKSLNPQYKRNIIPGLSKPRTLRLPTEAISAFLDQQDTIYAHRASEFFKNRRTVASVNSSRASGSTDGELTWYRIRQGDTLGGIARKFGVRISELRRWNGLRGNNIRAGRRLKIYR